MAEYSNQVESRQPADALEVEQLDANLYRSKRLWVPIRARGVFGGQSLHCYFLLSASPAIPILYHVDRVRDGRTYTTRAVRAVQKGRTIFIMLCSYQRPEPWQPTVQWHMPSNVPLPDQCQTVDEGARIQANTPGISLEVRTRLLDYAEERQKSFLIVKRAGIHEDNDGAKYVMYWFRVRDMPVSSKAFQKCILSYISDSHFIGVASRTAGLDNYKMGSKKLAMSSSLDHSIFFYNDDFDCSDWLLYVVTAPSIGSGRGVVIGRMYTQNGALVAVVTQEGVIRADVRGPDKAKL